MTAFMNSGDAELRHILKRYDPVAPLSEASLAALESGILARIETMPRRVAEDAVPAWMIGQNWGARAVFLAVMLVFVSGFYVGRVSYGRSGDLPFASSPTVLAMADENSLQPFSETLWGDNDDDDQ